MSALSGYRRVLAVVAHPDDESFGLGAVLDAFGAAGSEMSILCFTHGEASTLSETLGELREVRAQEFERAAAMLGATRARLLDYADGQLATITVAELAGHVAHTARDAGADLLLVFDEGGITGHPDHQRATEAAVSVGRSAAIDVLAWALPEDTAKVLNEEFSASFVGRPDAELDVRQTVDRQRQHRAIACHASQSTHNPVLWRRLELLGDSECLRFLHRAAASAR